MWSDRWNPAHGFRMILIFRILVMWKLVSFEGLILVFIELEKLSNIRKYKLTRTLGSTYLVEIAVRVTPHTQVATQKSSKTEVLHS